MRKLNRMGVEYKQAITAADPCPICEDNAAAGAIPIDEPFPSGDDRTPFHGDVTIGDFVSRAGLVDESVDVIAG